ncbi:short-subunit dehydrogenase [Jatrophihabitans sp. GAS493]|uniref:SDR family oxidoreductase n=1 Tax=Jatrophihabitans sp. GAS493 TaxID=1907575 RepID=UPI000BB7BFA9|nr:SDR family oxidoreductase [Jatrophihabitans sp. GAS493]SOD74869.1 short-subunit dehydrogenase [Jatrophihabitans sp. GAS493]
MELSGSVALVTGANRGLGRHFAEQLLARGATVYAAARNPDSVDLPGAIPIALDVTDPASIAAAVAATGNVSLLINNAGSSTGASLATGSEADIRTEMEVHYFGTLAVTRAFAPQLALAPRGSAVLNVLSALSWFTAPDFAPYAAAKSAEWSLTNALRVWLAGQGTRVSALHVGYMDTDMTAGLNVEKSDPGVIAKIALDGVESGEVEILADATSTQLRAGLSGGVTALYPQFA